MDPTDVAGLRQEYTLQGLHRRDLDPDPFRQFQAWFEESVKTAGSREPNAMTLATASPDGQPSARVVLLKGFDERGLTFFTNYDSRKGKQLEDNPRAAINFHWPWLERQIQVEGSVKKVTRVESERYFNRRPLGSRLGAIASPQSAVITSREVLERELERLQQAFGSNGEPPTPDNWGGYRLAPGRFEFWQGRENRLHDRFLYLPQSDGVWRIERLGP
jgi:pyridoxamine 5'-phosphate oxidase